MHFSTSAALTTALLPLLCLATQAPRGAVSAVSTTVAEWTILSMQRVCDAEDTECGWSFAIDTNTAGVAPTNCSYTVVGDPASEASVDSPGVTCGCFVVTSGWSGQFGPGEGFTTLSVVETEEKLIAWPAYTDAELEDGQVVTPDKSFAVQALS